MKLQITKSTTSKLVQLFIQDSSSATGAGLTGLVFNSASLTAYYYREGAATATAITLVTMTVGTWASGGFKEIDATNMPGWYQLGIPDAALASGANSVGIHLKGATNMAPLPLEIQLQNVDMYDGVRAGLTAIPNAAAEAAGGLFTRGTGAGQINQAANGMIDTNPVRLNNVSQSLLDLKDFADDGYDPATNKVQGVVLTDTVTTYTGNTPQTGDNFARLGAPAGASVSADIAAIEAQTDDIGTAGAGLTSLPWNAAWDAEVQSEVADALAVYDPPTHAELTAGLATADDAVLAALATVQADTDDIQARLPAALVSGRIDASVGAMAAGVVTATAVATGAIDADALATDAVAEIADAVWDEALAGHLTGGSTGAALNAAGAAGDPWTTAIPGAYSAGSAGFILGTNVDATISSRASQTSVDAVDNFVDTEITAIQTTLGTPAGVSLAADIAAIEAQTDDLGAAGAGLTAIPWNAAWDAEVQSEVADALGVYDPPTHAELTAELATADDATLAAIATVQADTDDIQSRLPAALVSGRMDASVGAMAADTVTAAAIATDAIGANELAASAVTEIQAAVAAGPVASVTGAVGSVTGNVTGSVGSLGAQAKADVNAEILDVLDVDVNTEITAIPAATATLRSMIKTVYAFCTNKLLETATVQTLRNRADSATIGAASVSDDLTTSVRGSYT